MELLKNKKSQFNYFYLIVVVFAITIRLIYLSYTDFHTRSYDAEAHIQYINFILNNHRLPPPHLCWECWQPPLYYISAAGFIQIAALGQTSGIPLKLQYFSLGIDMMCIIVSILIFKLLFKKKHLQYLAIMLFAFWPSHIIHSIRIGNDILFYFFTLMGLYFLLKWYDSPKKFILLTLSLVCGMFSLLTKTNGVILITVILINYVYYQLFKVRRLTLPLTMVIFFTLLTGVLFILQKNNINFIYNSENLKDGLRVKNEIEHFTSFHPIAFIKTPFTSPGNDTGGRQYFFMYLVKTALFGEFQFGNMLQIISAFNIQLLCIFFLTIAPIGLLNYRKKTFPLYLFFAFSLIAMVIFRIKYPFACSNDFRYIFPTLIVFIFLYIRSIDLLENKKAHFMSYMFFASGIAFNLFSIVFFLIPLLTHAQT